jgi:hypothetical protein
MLRLSHILTTAALVAVCAAPASAATFEQLHSTAQSDGASKAAADTGWRSSYQPAPQSRGAYVLNRDYGSPDALDAAPQPAGRDEYVLNRNYGSPDAVDAARNLPPVQIPVVEARDVPSSGFDWGDAGIGAAGMLALFSIAGGAALLLTGRKRGHGIA